jgi:hypothetical protein
LQVTPIGERFNHYPQSQRRFVFSTAFVIDFANASKLLAVTGSVFFHKFARRFLQWGWGCSMLTLTTQQACARPAKLRISADTFRTGTYTLACLSASVLITCLFERERSSWRHWGDLNPTSGVWIATAQDALHGELYRPLTSDVGYGGTRYAPLRALFQAGLIRIGMDPVRSAMVLSLGATITLLWAVYYLMRRLNVPGGWAAVLTCFLLSSNGVRTSVLGGLADPQAAFLSVAGVIAVTFVADQRVPSRRLSAIILAALCFSLAIATKETSVFGIGAGVVFLLWKGNRKESLFLASITGLLVLSGVAAMQWASGGRMVGVFRICATAGGNLSRIIAGPFALGHMLLRLDRSAGGFWIVALVFIFAARRWMNIPVLLMAGTTVIAMLILSTPGTDSNQAVDLQVASVLCIGTLMGQRGMLTSLAWVGMSAIVLYVSFRMVAEGRRIEQVDHRGQVAQAIDRVKQAGGTGPILSNDPLIPILLGERPYILDAFMFHVLVAKNPSIGQRLWNDLSARKFRSVTLMTSSVGPGALRTPGHFGADIVDRVEQAYLPLGPAGAYNLFVPKPSDEKKLIVH